MVMPGPITMVEGSPGTEFLIFNCSHYSYVTVQQYIGSQAISLVALAALQESIPIPTPAISDEGKRNSYDTHN